MVALRRDFYFAVVGNGMNQGTMLSCIVVWACCIKSYVKSYQRNEKLSFDFFDYSCQLLFSLQQPFVTCFMQMAPDPLTLSLSPEMCLSEFLSFSLFPLVTVCPLSRSVGFYTGADIYTGPQIVRKECNSGVE